MVDVGTLGTDFEVCISLDPATLLTGHCDKKKNSPYYMMLPP